MKPRHYLSPVLVALLSPHASLASEIDVPYQMRALDALGAPPAAPIDVRVRLYNSPTAIVDEVPLWDHTYVDQPLDGGFFSAILSGVDTDDLDGDVWIGVTLGSTPEWTPRSPLQSVPVSAHSESTSGVLTEGAPVGGCSEVGQIRWDTSVADLRVCDGTTWVYLNPTEESGATDLLAIAPRTDLPPVDPTAYQFTMASVGALPKDASLLLHFDGVGTTMVDSSSSGVLAQQISGDTTQTTEQSVFGGSSVYFDGNGDFLRLQGAMEAVSPGAGDFTVDTWVRIDDIDAKSQHTIFSCYQGSGRRWSLSVNGSGSARFIWSRATSGSDAVLSADGAVVEDTWAHIAAVRAGGIVSLYVDGVRTDQFESTDPIGCQTEPYYMGRATNTVASSQYLIGWVDDFRILPGTALWSTSTFSPPGQEPNLIQMDTNGNLERISP